MKKEKPKKLTKEEIQKENKIKEDRYVQFIEDYHFYSLNFLDAENTQ